MKLKVRQPITLLELSTLIDAELVGDPATFSTEIYGLADLEGAQPGSISFLSNPLYKKYLPTCGASAVILAAADRDACATTCLVSANPRLSLAKFLQLCDHGIVQRTTASIHPSVVLGANVTLGVNVVLDAGVVVGDDCIIGDNTRLRANVTLYERVTIGHDCTIHSGTVIGSDGFGYAMDAEGNWVKMLHLGGVVIGDYVEIGSNTSIDRGMIDNTVIGNRVIIDNLVQIGHNVRIGDKTAIAGCVGIAGSTSIGKNCLIGGASSIAGHLEITDRVIITGTSAVNHSINKPGVYSSGLPARENSVWRKNVARFMFLDNMARKIREIEKQLKELLKERADSL